MTPSFSVSREQLAQARGAPLPVSEIGEELPRGVAGLDPEQAMEGAVAANHAQGAIEHQERLANRVHDALREDARGLCALGTLGLGDVHEGDDQALDGVARRAIGLDAYVVPRAVRCGGLLGQRVEAAQDAVGVGQQLGIVEQHGEVGEGAADVGVDQAGHVPRARREAFHPERLIEEDRGDLDAVDQVQQVVVRLLEGLELLRELRVHGVELFVEGLRLFLRGLQLLVRALELFVDGLHFLVRGGELFVRRLELVDGALEVLSRVLELFLELRSGVGGAAARGAGGSLHLARAAGRAWPFRRRRAATGARDADRRCARSRGAARASLDSP